MPVYRGAHAGLSRRFPAIMKPPDAPCAAVSDRGRSAFGIGEAGGNGRAEFPASLDVLR